MMMRMALLNNGGGRCADVRGGRAVEDDEDFNIIRVGHLAGGGGGR